MDKKYKRLFKNSFWTLLGNAGSKVLGFLLLPLYTRWLGTAGFGESDLVTTYASFLVCIMTMCVADGIFVFTKNESDDVKKVFFTSALSFMMIVLFIWLLVWFALDVLFVKCNIHNSFANNLWLIYGIVVTTFLQQYIQQFILSLEKIKIYSFTGIIHSISTLFFSYLLIPSLGIKGYILAMIYANLATSTYSYIFSRSYIYFYITKIKKKNVTDILKYSIPLIPNGIMWWLVSAINRPIMEYNLSYSSIGIFAVANRFPSVIMMVFTVFSVAWNISVFEEYGKADYDEFYKKTFKMLFLVIIIVASIIILMSEFIISVFAAPEFHEAWQYMVLLIIGAVLSCISGFLGTNFSVAKQSKFFLYSSVWGALSSLMFNFLLIPRFGLWGASISVVLSFFVMMSTRYFYSLKFVKTSLLREIAIYSLAMIALSIIVIHAHQFWLKVVSFLSILMCVLVYERDVIMPMLRTIRLRLIIK